MGPSLEAAKMAATINGGRLTTHSGKGRGLEMLKNMLLTDRILPIQLKNTITHNVVVCSQRLLTYQALHPLSHLCHQFLCLNATGQPCHWLPSWITGTSDRDEAFWQDHETCQRSGYVWSAGVTNEPSYLRPKKPLHESRFLEICKVARIIWEKHSACMKRSVCFLPAPNEATSRITSKCVKYQGAFHGARRWRRPQQLYPWLHGQNPTHNEDRYRSRSKYHLHSTDFTTVDAQAKTCGICKSAAQWHNKTKTTVHACSSHQVIYVSPHSASMDPHPNLFCARSCHAIPGLRLEPWS